MHPAIQLLSHRKLTLNFDSFRLKNILSWCQEDAETTKRCVSHVCIIYQVFLPLSMSFRKRKWVVNGAIHFIDIPGCYYLDFLKQVLTQYAEKSRSVLLSGPRASGKLTRLNIIAQLL